MPNDAGYIFKCPKCSWWITGSHISPAPLTKLEVDEQMFNLKCRGQGCGWSGQLAGREGKPVRTAEMKLTMS